MTMPPLLRAKKPQRPREVGVCGGFNLPVRVVFDSEQAQPLRRGGRAGDATILGVENFGRPSYGPTTAAHLDQGADDSADHVVEESVGFDLEGDEIVVGGHESGQSRFGWKQIGSLPCPAPLDGEVEDGSDAGFPLGSAGLKAAEVVGAEQSVGGVLHGFGVKAAVDVVPGELSGENFANRAVVDCVAISLADGVADCVEALGRFRHVEDNDVVGQVGVEGSQQNIGRQLRIGTKPNDLAKSMNAGVGPAAGQDANTPAGYFGDGVFERSLHGRPIELELPTGVGRAVVCNGEFEGSQDPLVASGIGFTVGFAICEALVAPTTATQSNTECLSKK